MKNKLLICDNSFALKVKKKSEDISKFVMAVSRNHFKDSEKEIAQDSGITKFLKMGSIGLKLAQIAKGNAHIYINTSSYLGEWDACAPQIILEEAGGEVFDLKGEKLVYNTHKTKMESGFIATNKTNKSKILRVINEKVL